MRKTPPEIQTMSGGPPCVAPDGRPHDIGRHSHVQARNFIIAGTPCRDADSMDCHNELGFLGSFGPVRRSATQPRAFHLRTYHQTAGSNT